MTAHLLTIGDEILIGQIVDTNSAWMSQALNLRGIRVTGKSSVADTAEAIREGIRYALEGAEVVIATGGLGPTKDDITKKTLAEMLDSDMEFHAETYDRIESYFIRIGRTIPPAPRSSSSPSPWWMRRCATWCSMPRNSSAGRCRSPWRPR